MKKWFIAVFLFANDISSFGQQPAPKELSAEQKGEIIEAVAAKLARNYIFRDTARKYGEYLKSRLKSGAYSQVFLAHVFADSLKADLYKVYRDKHLSVMFNPNMEQALSNIENAPPPPGPNKHATNPVMEKKMNAGFKNVHLRPGNIGYVRWDNFSPPTVVNKSVVDQAFGFLSGAEAIIIDLRYNGGGTPAMVQYICNYLFDQPTHLNSIYERDKDTTVHFWTSPLTPNLSQVPVYVLTSQNTFSGAEEFSYNLKSLKRATIIGERTKGGAHPVRPFAAAHGIVVNIPYARAINPITKTNWEGSGVSPDISVPAYQAYDVAYVKALEQLVEINKGKPGENFFKWYITRVNALLNKTQVNPTFLEHIAGKYGPVTVELKGGQLLYKRVEQAVFAIVPLNENLMVLEGVENLMIEVLRDDAKLVTGIKISYDNGTSQSLKKEDQKLKAM